MKTITKSPLPLTLVSAWFVPTFVLLLLWVGETIGLAVPHWGAREYAWLMSTLMGVVLVIGIARLQQAQRPETRPGIKQVLRDLERAEEVAERTEAAVQQLRDALRNEGLVPDDEAGHAGTREESEGDQTISRIP